jgi:hypothetical protein
MLTAAAGLACFDVTWIRAQHVSTFEVSSLQQTGLARDKPDIRPRATKWASLRQLDADLLKVCGPRDQTSDEAERHRRTRSFFIRCQDG